MRPGSEVALLRSLLVTVLAAAIPSGPPPARPVMSRAYFVQVNASGIEGEVAVLDTGNPEHGLIISGWATGFDPSQSYFSRIYDQGLGPFGPPMCELRSPRRLTGAQMAVGFWDVAPDGTGTLFALKPGASYASLEEVGAMSIRMVAEPRDGRFELRSCAEIVGR